MQARQAWLDSTCRVMSYTCGHLADGSFDREQSMSGYSAADACRGAYGNCDGSDVSVADGCDWACSGLSGGQRSAPAVRVAAGNSSYFPLLNSTPRTTRLATPFRVQTQASLGKVPAIIADLDGDGVTDILQPCNEHQQFHEPGGYRHHVHLNNGNAEFESLFLDMSTDAFATENEWHRWQQSQACTTAALVGDLDCDGNADILFLKSTRYVWWGDDLGGLLTVFPNEIWLNGGSSDPPTQEEIDENCIEEFWSCENAQFEFECITQLGSLIDGSLSLTNVRASGSPSRCRSDIPETAFSCIVLCIDRHRRRSFSRSPATLGTPKYTTSAAIFDANGDGFQDIFIANAAIGIQPPDESATILGPEDNGRNDLLLNDGSGNFAESVDAGDAVAQSRTNSLAVAVGDLNVSTPTDPVVAVLFFSSLSDFRPNSHPCPNDL
eukprot:SAG31_NODE_2111_length_6426_cov_4.423295_2_plen_438_part_00